VRFSYWASSQQSWSQLLASAQHVERTGWDGMWIADHLMPGPGFGDDDGGPHHEAWTVLGALAASVPRIRIGPLVSGNTYRNPALLLKMAVTVDHISDGRLVLGIGAGWQENEHRAYGFDFGSIRSRIDRLDEACQIIRALLDQDPDAGHAGFVDFAGAHYALVAAPLSPRPVGPLPLLVGAKGEQRTMRIAARYADEWNIWGAPETMIEKGRVLERWCEVDGRDPSEIRRSACALLFLSDDDSVVAQFRGVDWPRPAIVGTPAEVVETVAAYHDAGVDELIIPDFNLGDPVRRHAVLDLFIEAVAPTFR
jgi:F420-dependent oxidoreductase-like protein